MLEYMYVLWIGIIVMALLVEAVTPSLVSIWFVPGGLVALVLALVKVPVWIQTVVFFALSILLLVLSKTIFKRFFKTRKPTSTNADLLIGKEALVIEKIDNINGCGQVKLQGQVWSARTDTGDVTVEKDEIVRVIRIEGVKLIVEPRR